MPDGAPNFMTAGGGCRVVVFWPGTGAFDVARRVREVMPGLQRELGDLVAIPSISVPGQIDKALMDAFEFTSALFEGVGVEVARLDLPDTAPVVTGSISAPEGAPTVLLYSHDVVPAGDESLWDSPPFVPSERDGALYAANWAAIRSSNFHSASTRPCALTRAGSRSWPVTAPILISRSATRAATSLWQTGRGRHHRRADGPAR